MQGDRKNTQGEESIGQLIAAAGPGETASTEAKERVYQAVYAHWRATARPRPHSSSRRRFGRFRAVGLAAGVAVAAVAVYWLKDTVPDGAAAPEIAELTRIDGPAELLRDGARIDLAAATGTLPIAAGDRLRTAAGGRLALALGGISLRVNVDTDLSLADAGHIELREGTIYIDSGADGSAARLQVVTPLGSIEHVGTQYEVRLGGTALRLRVREGAVVVTGSQSTAVAMAGEQLDFDRTGLSARGRIAADADAWDWASGLAALTAADAGSLGDILAWAARESGLTVEYANAGAADRLARQSLDGVELLLGFNPDETLAVIRQTTNLRFTTDNGRLTILD